MGDAYDVGMGQKNGTGLIAIAAVLTLLFNVVNARIDAKFEVMNQRFDDMNQRFDAVDQRMDRMTDSIDALRGDLVRLGERVSSNKGALDLLSQQIHRISDAPGGDATP